jgi:hypothetical protein
MKSEVYPIVKTILGAKYVWCKDLAVAYALLSQVPLMQMARP